MWAEAERLLTANIPAPTAIGQGVGVVGAS